jgi:hypothetical protein
MAEIIDGTTVRMGGVDYVVAPLNFRQVRALQSKITTLGQIAGVVSDEQMSAIIEITKAALSRNYPEITVEQVEDMIDLGNAGKVIGAIMGVSGLEKKAGETQGNP